MENHYSRNINAIVLITILSILSFLIVKPIFLSIIFGFILAFIFSPIYRGLSKLTKMPNLSAIIITVFLLLLVIFPIWFFTPDFVNQGIKVYNFTKNVDYAVPLKSIFPSLFSSGQFSIEIDGALHSFIPKIADYFRNYLENTLFNLPILFLKFIVVLFVFYFSLRDENKLLDYIKNILPFSKDVKEKVFGYSKAITFSVLYGTVILGIVQGIFIGIGFFIFKAPSALILTILAIIASILPAIPTGIIWVPVVIYFFAQGNITAGIGILGFGILSIIMENLLRPLFISRRVKFHSSIILIGMVGGLFPFGMFGIILGPLLLSYLYIMFEVLKDKKLI